MAELHKIVATVKTALEAGATAAPPPPAPASSAVPVTSTAQRAELASRFARELEAVAGRFLGVVAPAEAPARAVALAREIGARSVAIGAGVVNDARAIATALEDAGLAVVHSAPIRSAAERAAMRAGMAQSDLGIAEAHCAIAATGTLAVIATEHRPASLTLLPPASLIIVDIDRILPDLAAALAMIGPDLIGSHRVSLITGPSRTADIEKRIVLGVHGPKALYVLVTWPRND